jgi:PAS domain S-box-containing protein
MKGEQYYQSIINSVQEPILVIDRNYRIVDANEAARQAFGDGKAIGGRACFEVTHRTSVPCHASGEQCPVRSVFQNGLNVRMIHEHPHAGGKTVLEEILASPLRNEAGQVEYVIEEMRDLTEVLKNRKLVAELQGEVKTLRALVPICSHCKKIRNPEGAWVKPEEYIANHTESDLTHGICPDCVKQYFEPEGPLARPSGSS